MVLFVISPNPGALEEYLMIEIQGDLESRYVTDCSGKFVGDLLYNKFGHPVSYVFIVIVSFLFITLSYFRYL